ncbi:MAG TPA: F0F1 ATP synthase subunit gamma [Polyangiaceae bacterium]|nr:F0F1 ATP synthase subunit gamma [Polyangiaceae bacterium]
MQRLADLQARIHGLGELREVVGAMRSLAAVRVTQAQEALVAIREYATVVERALSDSAPDPPPGRAPETEPVRQVNGVVAFGSEHGFVGAYNDRVLDRAVALLGGRSDRLLVVGSRAALIAAERRCAVSSSGPMASQVGGIDEVALRTAAEIARGVTQGLTQVVLVYTQCTGGTASAVAVERLLPFDFTPYVSSRGDRRPPPLSNLTPQALFAKLVEELTFTQLARAAMESFASENAARLAAMEAAHENIENKLNDLTRLEREGRQEEITTELLDIVTGAEVIGRPSSASAGAVARSPS